MAVIDLTCVITNSNTAVLKWSTPFSLPHDELSYNLHYSTCEAFSSSLEESYIVLDNFAIVGNLSSDTCYSFSVTPVLTGHGEGEEQHVSCTTLQNVAQLLENLSSEYTACNKSSSVTMLL